MQLNVLFYPKTTPLDLEIRDDSDVIGQDKHIGLQMCKDKYILELLVPCCPHQQVSFYNMAAS